MSIEFIEEVRSPISSLLPLGIRPDSDPDFPISRRSLFNTWSGVIIIRFKIHEASPIKRIIKRNNELKKNRREKVPL
jgi:hypothetical protein